MNVVHAPATARGKLAHAIAMGSTSSNTADRAPAGGARIAELLAALDAAPGHAATLRTAHALEPLLTADAGLTPCRIALVSNYTVRPLAAYVLVECARIGVGPTFYVSEYGQVEPDLLSPDSPLERFEPDLTFIALGMDGLAPRDVADPLRAADEALDRLIALTQAFRERTRGAVVVHNFVTPPLSPSDTASGLRSPAAICRRLNLALAERFAGTAGVSVFDMDALVADHGRAHSRHDKLFYVAGMEMSETLLPEVAYRSAAYVKALLGRTRKCVVFDCDDTLWGGIVGEDGLGGIRLGPTGVGRAFADVQEWALSLYRRGVLLAVCSKNNAADVDAVLAHHPHMRLRAEHLAALRVNWQDKVTNLREIAAELNIGLDSLVFIDDNPVERAHVRQALPDVLVPELPADPALRPRFLGRLNDFAAFALTAEDAERSAFYAQERQRRSLQASSQSLEDFLHTLELRMRITVDEAAILPRLAQLAARTNQFNLTTRRHPEREIARMMQEPSHRVYAVRAADRFGDNGVVALLICACEPSVWHVDTCLMSCRVIGRGIETALLARVAADAAAAGAQELRGEYIQSPKNALVADFYPRHGFAPLGEPTAGQSLWSRKLPGDPPLTPPAWIRLEDAGDP